MIWNNSFSEKLIFKNSRKYYLEWNLISLNELAFISKNDFPPFNMIAVSWLNEISWSPKVSPHDRLLEKCSRERKMQWSWVFEVCAN